MLNAVEPCAFTPKSLPGKPNFTDVVILKGIEG